MEERSKNLQEEEERWDKETDKSLVSVQVYFEVKINQNSITTRPIDSFL